MLSQADKIYLIEDMILGLVGDMDPTDTASLIDEFIGVARKYMAAGTLSPISVDTQHHLVENEPSGVHSSNKVASERQIIADPLSHSNGSQCTIDNTDQNRQDQSYPNHVDPLLSLLIAQGVDSSRIDMHILDYVLEACADELMDDSDLVEMVRSYFPELMSSVNLEQGEEEEEGRIRTIAELLRTAAEECKVQQTEDTPQADNPPVHPDLPTPPSANTERDTHQTQIDAVPLHPDITELLLLCPHVPEEVVRFVYEVKFAGVKADAGVFLVENGSGDVVFQSPYRTVLYTVCMTDNRCVVNEWGILYACHLGTQMNTWQL